MANRTCTIIATHRETYTEIWVKPMTRLQATKKANRVGLTFKEEKAMRFTVQEAFDFLEMAELLHGEKYMFCVLENGC